MNELLKLGAFELARKIRKKNVSSLEVVDAHIARIEEVNPKINAVVADRFEAARAEARMADEAVAADAELPPLHGVPCTIKETLGLGGMPQTGGSTHRRHVLCEQDSTAVARIREAGAIPLGVTNIPEMAMWVESYNKIYGHTKNPYGLDRSAGGSSGGEGAIVGAGASPFGLGSDVGGSIRMPASFCGVFGHKPTGGAVPMTGHFPLAKDSNGRYVTIGPIARRARDLMPLLQIIAGPDGVDPQAIDLEFGNPKAKFKDRKVYVCKNLRAGLSWGPSLDQDLAMDRAALMFSNKGAEIIEWSSPLMKRAVEIWSAMLSESGGPSFGEQLGGGKAPNYPLELFKLLFGLSDYSAPGLIFGLGEQLFKTSPADQAELVKLGHQLRAEMDALFADGSVLLTPTHPRTAPKHHTPWLRPFDFIYTGIFNVLEVPATTAPMGIGSDRMPLGVQIVAGRGQDHLTIAGAMLVEKVNGGWAVPITSLMDNPPGTLR